MTAAWAVHSYQQSYSACELYFRSCWTLLDRVLITLSLHLLYYKLLVCVVHWFWSWLIESLINSSWIKIFDCFVSYTCIKLNQIWHKRSSGREIICFKCYLNQLPCCLWFNDFNFSVQKIMNRLTSQCHSLFYSSFQLHINV